MPFHHDHDLYPGPYDEVDETARAAELEVARIIIVDPDDAEALAAREAYRAGRRAAAYEHRGQHPEVCAICHPAEPAELRCATCGDPVVGHPSGGDCSTGPDFLAEYGTPFDLDAVIAAVLRGEGPEVETDDHLVTVRVAAATAEAAEVYVDHDGTEFGPYSIDNL